jgi:hypothetical protein
MGLWAVVVVLSTGNEQEALASCGSATCFVVTAGEAGTVPKGTLTMDLSYRFAALDSPPDGASGRIAAASVDRRRIVLDEHKEFRSANQSYQLDINYGLTDRLTVELTVPYLRKKHKHRIEVGETQGGAGDPETWGDNGVGDIRLTGKYALLPTIRSLVVVGAGVELPTGDNGARNIGNRTQEPTLQIGRGAFGIVGSLYQSYEIIPHRLNQFAAVSYRHTFENSDEYQFGDEYILSAGLNLKATERLTLSGQFNWRYVVHDVFAADLRQAQAVGPGDPIILDGRVLDRPVPNTGATILMFSPGLSVGVSQAASAYFFVQVPITQDFNSNLEQGVSYLVGMSYQFN